MGTDVDAATQARLDRGYRMVEVLKQGQYEPLTVIDQILIIYAGTRGHLDTVPRDKVQAWEKQFLTVMHTQKQEVWDELDQKKDLTEDITKKIESALKEFQAQFAAGATAAQVHCHELAGPRFASDEQRLEDAQRATALDTLEDPHQPTLEAGSGPEAVDEQLRV